jgi:hypothetical protein
MVLKELKMMLNPEDFDRFVELYETKVEIYTNEWFEIEELKDEILEQYGLDDLYGFKANDDDDDDSHEDEYYDDEY